MPREKKSKAPKKTAREVALDLVAKRALSRHELEQRLARRGYAPDEIEDAVALIDEYNYIDDEALAAAVQREAARTGRGTRWVQQTLMRRQIAAKPTSSAHLDHESMQRARTLLERRYGDTTALDPKDKGRAYAFLARRGFTPDAIRTLLDVDDLLE
ncbi:MAG: regulatory protein RecX [Myxococcota bacterium]